MAQVQPSTNNAPPPATNGQSAASSSNPQQVAPISWEGDRMFNVYIHDYFLKRGFRKAAKELVLEAEIGNDASPPINARQGFLFEWWSVFWMFFSAKTTGQGPENVMLYFHWIQNQAERNRQLQQENEQRRAAQLPLTTQPPPRAIARPPPNGIRPPGMVNGAVPMPQPGQPSPATQALQYPMGVPHGPMPPSHQQPPPGPGQPQPQINGIVDPSAPHGMTNPQRPPSQQQQTRPGPHGSLPQPQQGHPPPSHPNAVPHLQPSQRQVSRGQHEAMRPPGQFHSPTMGAAPPPGPGQQGPLAAHPHMPGMSGPMPQMGAPGAQHLAQHQHIGRGPPPQGGQPNTASPRNPSQTPTQSYQQLMNPGGPMGPPQAPGSRSGTPGGNPLTQRSPALAAREPPPQGQTQAQSVNEEMSRRFQQQQHQHQQQHQQHQQRNSQQEQQEIMSMEQNLARIPPVFLAQMKMEAGVNDREIGTLSYEEKSRLNTVFKKTMANYNGTTAAPNQARTGRPGPTQQSLSGMPMGPPQGPQNRQPAAQRGQKRSSTSPGDEHQGTGDSTPKELSPPDRKRQRGESQVSGAQTPGGTDTSAAAPPMGSIGGFPPNHPGNHPGGYSGPPAPQQQPNLPNGFRGGQMGGPMNPPAGQPVPNVGGMTMGGMTPVIGHTMPPGMAHMNPALANQHIHQMPNSQVGSSGRPPLPSPEISYPFQNQSQQMQQQQLHYRQTMAAQHLHKMPGSIGANAPNPANPNPSPSSDAHDPARTGPAGAASVGNRPPQQNKPGSMMPPASPAHRADNTNTQKGPGMMPPPSQHGTAANNTGGASKEQTAPSPAGGRHEAATSSSPSMRPASRSGAGAPTSANASSAPPSLSQGSGGGPATPASAGGNNNSTSNTTAPSPSAVLTSRISPSATMNSLPRPQTSASDTATGGNTGPNVPPAPPQPPSSAPPSSTGAVLPNNLFGDFFDSMEDNFGLDTFSEAIDPAEFSQWIDMNPLS